MTERTQSDLVAEIIKLIRPDPGCEARCREKIGETLNGHSAVSGFSRAKMGFDKAMLAALREAAIERGDDPDKVGASEHWTLHDLRPTAAAAWPDSASRLMSSRRR